MVLTAYKPGEHDWCYGDSQKQYLQLVDAGQVDAHYWQDNSFTYNFNSWGFRDREFVTGVDYSVALGCSLTVGIGIPESWRWGERLGCNMNLAEGGTSQENCFRFLRWAVEQGYSIKKVYYLEPIAHRRLHWRSNIEQPWHTVCAWNTYSNPIDIQRAFLNKAAVQESQTRVRYALYGLSCAAGFDISVVSVDDPRIHPFYGTDLARDASHPGREGNIWLADNFDDLAKPIKSFLN